MSFDRFDFEQQLIECWNITKDIKTLYEAVGDRDPAMSQDEIMNVLLGLESLYELKFDKLWHMFETGIREKAIVSKETEVDN